MHDALAFQMPRQRLPASGPFLRSGIANARCGGIVIIGATGRFRHFRFRLPCLPSGGKQGQLIDGELFAFAVAPGIQ